MLSFLPGENKRFWVVAIHAAAWIVYIGFLYVANRLSDPSIKLTNAILFMLPFCAVFYVSIYWLGRYRKIGASSSVVSFVGTFLVLAGLGYLYMYFMLPAANIQLYQSDEFRHFAKASVLGYIQYYSYALLYFVVNGSFKKEQALRKLQEEQFTKELENAKLKEQELKAQKEKLLIEYAFLRAQVNPHFLHNTLNTLFSQAQEYSEELAGNIAKLARMMRYSLESVEYESDIVPVEKELENLELLIEINNIRFEGEKTIDYSVEGTVENQTLPPLSLITVVENAFKYGDLSDPLHPLTIRVSLKPETIYFFCRNKKRKRPAHIISNNIGEANLKKRLEVAFHNRYNIQTADEDNFYTFELTIESDNYDTLCNNR